MTSLEHSTELVALISFGLMIVFGAAITSFDAIDIAVPERDRPIVEPNAVLVADDTTKDDRFGISASLSGDRIAIGADRRRHDGEHRGKVFIFETGSDTDKWFQSAVLQADGAPVSDHFGHSVSLDGDRLFVGAPKDIVDGQTSGKVYVFEYDEQRNNWSLAAELTPDDSAPAGRFGTAVSVDGDRALIGANEQPASHSTGAAYIFEYDAGDEAWEQTEKLESKRQKDRFGTAVALDDDSLLVSATSPRQRIVEAYDADGGSSEGWTYQSTIRGPADARYTRHFFGYSTDLAGDHALIASHEVIQRPYYQACNVMTYFYVRPSPKEQWVKSRVVSTARGRYFTCRPSTVALDDDVAVYGATSRRGEAGHSFVADQYDQADGEWIRRAELPSVVRGSSTRFGTSLMVDDGRVVVTDKRADPAKTGSSTGGAYVFDISDRIADGQPTSNTAIFDSERFVGLHRIVMAHMVLALLALMAYVSASGRFSQKFLP